MPEFKTIRDLEERATVTGADWLEVHGADASATEKKTIDGVLGGSSYGAQLAVLNAALRPGQFLGNPDDPISLDQELPRGAYPRAAHAAQRFHGARYRLQGEVEDDHGGVSMEWYRRDTAPMDGVALSDALYRNSHVIWSYPGYQFATYPSVSRLSNSTVTMQRGIAPGSAPHGFYNPANHMWSFNGVTRFRLRGTFHGRFRAVPASAYGCYFINCSYIYIDELILENCNTALYFDNCSNIYIGRVIAPGATARIVATATAQNIRIGEIISTGTDSINASATVAIGPFDNANLAALAKLVPTANKAIAYDASGVPQLMDWIIGGTFTPSVSCDTPGDLALSGVTATGTYNKRGRQVEIIISLVFTPTYTGAASGNFRITGLPFVAEGGTSEAVINFKTTTSQFTWPSGATQIVASAVTGQAYLNIVGHKSLGSTATAAISAFASGVSHTLRLSGIYRSAS